MKTINVVLTITVPDEVIPRQIKISSCDNGYIINAYNTDGEQINIGKGDNCTIDYCNDPITPSQIFICWGINDFEYRASILEGYTDDIEESVIVENKPKSPIFDRSKFVEALGQMDHDHDANFGITWDTIDEYLDSYCRLSNS